MGYKEYKKLHFSLKGLKYAIRQVKTNSRGERGEEKHNSDQEDNNSKNEEEKGEGIDGRLQIVLKVDDTKQSDEQKKFINSEASTSYFFNGKQKGLILPSQQSLSLMIEQVKGEMVSLKEEITAKENSREEVTKRIQKEESLNTFLDQYLPHPSL